MLIITNHADFVDGVGKCIEGCYIVAKGDLTGLINNHDLDRVRSGEFVDQSVGKHRKGAKHDWNILETFDLAFEFSGGDDILVDILV